jgi:hypothetical protein
MTWAKRPAVYRQHVLGALNEIVAVQTRAEGDHGTEGPRPHREWAGAAQDAIAILTAAVPAKRTAGYPRAFAMQILVVDGRGRFPLEMADRDTCAPYSEADALRMYDRGPRLGPDNKIQIVRIVLRRFIAGAIGVPHLRRWESFGWQVVWYGTPDDYAMSPKALRDPTSDRLRSR